MLIARRQICAQIRDCRSNPGFCGTGVSNLGQQDLQGQKGSYVDLGMVSRPRRRACRPVKHPQRQLKRKTRRFAGQVASSDGGARFLHRTVNGNNTPRPRMPAIKNLLLFGNMGGREANSTTLSGRTVRSATNHRRPRPSSLTASIHPSLLGGYGLIAARQTPSVV